MSLVVDASVACKWFVAEAQSEQAAALLAGGDVLIAPDLIVPELCNVAWRKQRRGEIGADQSTSMVDSLPALLDELVPSEQLAARAFAIANELIHLVWECFYLALAELRGTRLVTADRRLVSRLGATPWAHLPVGLGDVS